MAMSVVWLQPVFSLYGAINNIRLCLCDITLRIDYLVPFIFLHYLPIKSLIDNKHTDKTNTCPSCMLYNARSSRIWSLNFELYWI